MPPKRANPPKNTTKSSKGLTAEEQVKTLMKIKKQVKHDINELREEQLEKLDKEELDNIIKREKIIREQKKQDGKLLEDYSDDSGMEEESELEAQQAFEDIGNFIVEDEEDDKAKDKRLVAEEKKSLKKVSKYFEEEAEEKPRKSKKKMVESSDEEDSPPPKTKQIQKKSKASEPVVSLTMDQIEKMLAERIKAMGIPQIRQDPVATRLDSEGRCRDCTAIFKANPNSEGGKVSENKFQTGSEKEGKVYAKVFASIPCKECQTSMIRRLETVGRHFITMAKDEENLANPYGAMMLAFFAPVLPYFAKGRSLEEITKKKTEIFGFEETAGEVKLRMSLDGNVIGFSKGMSVLQHFSYGSEGWTLSNDGHNALETYERIAQKLYPDYVFETNCSDMICQALGKDFIPPKPLKLPAGQLVNFESLDF